jgi:hypothetical protein
MRYLINYYSFSADLQNTARGPHLNIMAKTSGPRGELIPLHSFDHKFNAAENPYTSNFPEERLPTSGNASQIANKSGPLQISTR